MPVSRYAFAISAWQVAQDAASAYSSRACCAGGWLSQRVRAPQTTRSAQAKPPAPASPARLIFEDVFRGFDLLVSMPLIIFRSNEPGASQHGRVIVWNRGAFERPDGTEIGTTNGHARHPRCAAPSSGEENLHHFARPNLRGRHRCTSPLACRRTQHNP